MKRVPDPAHSTIIKKKQCIMSDAVTAVILLLSVRFNRGLTEECIFSIIF